MDDPTQRDALLLGVRETARETQPLVSCCPTQSLIPSSVDAGLSYRDVGARATNHRTCSGAEEAHRSRSERLYC